MTKKVEADSRRRCRERPDSWQAGGAGKQEATISIKQTNQTISEPNNDYLERALYKATVLIYNIFVYLKAKVVCQQTATRPTA